MSMQIGHVTMTMQFCLVSVNNTMRYDMYDTELALKHWQTPASLVYSVRQKKYRPKVFRHFLSNRSEFLHEISHIYYSFIIT